MELWPAIDLHNGRAVRLLQGDFSRRHDYGDPVQLARTLVSEGATRLHVVDLDAARTGLPVNRKLVSEISEAEPDVLLQVGGGVRSAADVSDLIAIGVERAVLGTAAIEHPAELARCAEQFPFRVALGLDYRRRPDGELVPAIRGWLEGSNRTCQDILSGAAKLPLAAVVVTAIDRDGTLGGPDIDGLAAILDETELPVMASGGVANATDLRALADLRSPNAGRRLAGVVVGKAILDGKLTIREASESCAPSG